LTKTKIDEFQPSLRQNRFGKLCKNNSGKTQSKQRKKTLNKIKAPSLKKNEKEFRTKQRKILYNGNA